MVSYHVRRLQVEGEKFHVASSDVAPQRRVALNSRGAAPPLVGAVRRARARAPLNVERGQMVGARPDRIEDLGREAQIAGRFLRVLCVSVVNPQM